jgi:1,4-dihydroxy-6-naphthoate synthase
MTILDIGYSPCPNDTFIFHALVHRLVDCGGLQFVSHIMDVEELNRLAFEETFAVTKASFYAYLQLKNRYDLLDAGAALGYGCGPMVVARKGMASLAGATIAVPGQYTTAYLLLQLWQPDIKQVVITRFDRILPGIAAGKYDAGVIIHEGRFVYRKYQCEKQIDLGQWWENKTKLPIPLGCMLLRKDMAVQKTKVESALRASVEYAWAHPEKSKAFIKRHAQEMDAKVMADHIGLYVNDFTKSLGKTGKHAVHTLEEMARWAKIL